MRDLLELKAGHKGMRGRKGSAYAYNDSRQREAERQWVEQDAYKRFVAAWGPKAPKQVRTGASPGERR